MEHPYYPVFIRLTDKPVLLVGGGFVAAEKIDPLIQAGARITVVSPMLRETVQERVDAGKATWVQREFRDSDLDDVFMVIAATDDTWVNHWIFQACENRNLLANVVDDTENCNFIVPSIARSGPVQVAVSTSGTSPTLARTMREKIQATMLGPEVGRLAEWLYAWREPVKRVLDTFQEKKHFWNRVFDTDINDLVKQGHVAQADQSIQHLLDEAADEKAAKEEAELATA